MTTLPDIKNNQKPTRETLVNYIEKNMIQPLPPGGNAEEK